MHSDGKPVGEVINLGVHGSDFDWKDEQQLKAKMFKKKRIQKYHTQYYVNGTECTVIKHKRDTEVRVGDNMNDVNFLFILFYANNL